MTDPKNMEERRAEGEIYRGMFEQGLSVREIAEQKGVNRSTVERWVYKVFKCSKRRPTYAWTEEMDDTLKRMWAQNRTAVEIGKAVGMSKGSVLGRRFRLKLENHASGGDRGVRKPRGAKSIKRQKVQWNAGRTIIDYPTREPIGFMELEDSHCREVMGRGSDGLATYCGNHRLNDLPYCVWHTRVNYQA